MNESAGKPSREREDFVGRVDAQARRRLRARRSSGMWFGLGTTGLIGWSVAIPTLIGAALGHWLDGRQAGDRSWTLALLIAGLLAGCWNAWRWVAREHRAMREEDRDDDE